MSRITKTVAEEVAKQLCAVRKEELKQIQQDLNDFITSIYEPTIPKLVMDAYKKHKGFIYTTSSVRLTGEGLADAYKNYQLSSTLPKCNSCDRLNVSAEQAATIIAFNSQYEDKQKAMLELRTSIEVALFNLRTYNNVEKEFPEAFKFLPPATTSAIAINIKDIRCKLDKANC